MVPFCVAVCRVSRRYKELAMAAGMIKQAILPLKAALNHLRRSREVVTPIHADFLQA